MIKKIIFLNLAVLLFSCSQKHEENTGAFYYWKTVYKVSPAELDLLKNLSIKKIYLRMFDVDWDQLSNAPVPLGQITFADKPDVGFEFVPVVFITNKTFQKISQDQVSNLVEKIYIQVKTICKDNFISYREFQLDCDWTESTREKYFALIEQLKEKLHKENILLSATIRLHQIKYFQRTGIPSVDRGMLMFYNMGVINPSSKTNSIYNDNDAGKYTGYFKNYKLHLDIALPIFSWVIHSRQGEVIGLLDKKYIDDLRNDHRFTTLAEDIFAAGSSFFLHGKYFMKGDQLKVEDVSPALCDIAARKAAANLINEKRSIAFFDLDTLNISRYYEKDFKKILTWFN